MGLPIATAKGGICFAFPDVCKTPVGNSSVPIPYPNIGQLKDAEEVSKQVLVAGYPVILKNSYIPKTKGDEAGTEKGVKSKTVGGKVTFATHSGSVKINSAFVVRMTDKTDQNADDDEEGNTVGNARGTVLGGVSNVRCG